MRATSEIPESNIVKQDDREVRSCSEARSQDNQKKTTMVVRLHPGHRQTISAKV